MTTLATREAQMFPTLSPTQLQIARRFASGPEVHFKPGASIYDIGSEGAPAWLVLDGSIEVRRRDGLSADAPITTHGVGQFSGEVNQLAGRPSIAEGRAGSIGCTALPFDQAHLRALMIGSAEIGEIVMRALILRRVSLIEDGGAGVILIGVPGTREITGLQGFLTRSGVPNLFLDVRSDEHAKALVERSGMTEQELPLVVCPAGPLLKRPTIDQLAACIGIVPAIDPSRCYDVAIVGAGPAGLATSVYGASEGLSVIVLDARTLGGQAGASARIENYLGFPTGISGQALAGRAFNQALKFGAEIAIPLAVERLACEGGDIRLHCSGDRTVTARTVVIASGAAYRRPDVPNLSFFEGAGVSYWASPVEARLCKGEEIALVGGGNSAGQAAVFLAPHVKRLHLIARRDLSETMSRYLIDRIGALPNVEMHIGSEIAGLEGDETGALAAATVRNRANGTVTRCQLRHLFLFIGAVPNSTWAQGCVETD